MALARYIVMLLRVLHRKGHKKFAVDRNDVERGIGIRQLWIDKRWRRGQGVKIDIIHFHHAAPEIGDIQAGHAHFIRGDGEPFIDGAGLRVGVGVEVVAGAVNRDDPLRAHSIGAVEARARRTDTGVPADDRPILGCKEERAGAEVSVPSAVTPEIMNPGVEPGKIVILKTVPVGVPLLPKRSFGVGMLTTSGLMVTEFGALTGTL